MTREDIINFLDDDDQVIFYEPECFDAAIIGLTSNSPGWAMKPRVCYSTQKVLDVLQRDFDMAYDEAVEYFDFNIQGFGLSDPPPPLLVWDWE